MGEKLVSSILKSVAGPIQTSVGSSSNSAYSNANEDVEELRRIVLRIQATLDAEERDAKDEAVKLWLKELKDLACDVEDIVDKHDYQVLRSKVQGQNRFETATHKRKREEVCNLITSTVSNPNDFEYRIKEIRKRFDEITRDRDALRLTEEDGEKLISRSYKAAKLPPTTSSVRESDVYGRENDKEKVIELLLQEGESSQHNVSVIPIVGASGIGKTTLAQFIYNDRRACQYFSHRAWICVSEDFDVSRLLKEILESLTKEPCNQTNTSVLCENLRSQLEGKRFLLILDDVWNEKHGLWESVKAPVCGVGICKIIVTTRHESVARIMQTTLPYHLDFLPEDICLSLFWDRAFGGRDPDEYANLVEIGKEIVRNCRGLPSAVRRLGGLLRFETNGGRWMDILDHSALWELEEEKDDLLPAL